MTVGATVHGPDNSATVIASTDVADSDGWVRGLREAASAKPLNQDTEIAISVSTDHPSASAFTPGRIVRIVDDTGEVNKFEILTTSETRIHPDASKEVLVVSGRTLLNQWRNALVRGWQADLDVEPQSPTRAWGYGAPDADESAWTGTAYAQTRSSSTFARPANWPDPYTAAVWPQVEAGSHTVGWVFARREFTLSTAGQVVFYLTADDGIAASVDGERCFSKFPTGAYGAEHVWHYTHRFALQLPAGDHLFALEAVNLGGPGAIWVSAWRTDGAILGDPIFITGPSSGSSDPMIGDWKWLAYPADRPGVPVGRPIVDFLTQAQAADDEPALDNWTLDFTATTDSASNAWPVSEFGISVDKNGFDLLESLCAEWMDVRVKPGDGKVLEAHVAPMGASAVASVDEDQVERLVVETSI